MCEFLREEGGYTDQKKNFHVAKAKFVGSIHIQYILHMK